MRLNLSRDQYGSDQVEIHINRILGAENTEGKPLSQKMRVSAESKDGYEVRGRITPLRTLGSLVIAHLFLCI